MRLDLQAALDRLLGQQSGGHHHAGLLVLVQLVMAAMTTAPWPMSRRGRLDRTVCASLLGSASAKPRSLIGRASALRNDCFTSTQRHAVLRPLGPGQAGLDRAQVEPQASCCTCGYDSVAADRQRNSCCSLA